MKYAQCSNISIQKMVHSCSYSCKSNIIILILLLKWYKWWCCWYSIVHSYPPINKILQQHNTKIFIWYFDSPSSAQILYSYSHLVFYLLIKYRSLLHLRFCVWMDIRENYDENIHCVISKRKVSLKAEAQNGRVANTLTRNCLNFPSFLYP